MGIDNITSKIICEAGQKADDILRTKLTECWKRQKKTVVSKKKS